jgi:serine/threonine-protein kinase
MTSEKYIKVKEIFLEACDKPPAERDAFVKAACGADDELLHEVESLLKEHSRDVQVIPAEPEGPLGPMSAILSHANIQLPQGMPLGSEPSGVEMGAPVTKDDADAPRYPSSREPRRRPGNGNKHEDTRYLDESSGAGQESHSGIVDAGRFMAGTVVGNRYRIIELLGRGGMGEVYRADDITLNQSIALKFLPALFGQDQKWLERFRNEVRLARQVTHPNVCRVFDISEFQGEQFISMEYVDGENLASLLRRIGRVPHDKAIQIARQLCAGLAAAHDRGVLHRDLKPANVMIDGRGSVRITDFGLAAPVDQMRAEGAGGGAIRAGTPAYMSPEQLAGKPVTVRSDVYSLGLVLYEMFTGKRAFRADSLRGYQKLHSSEEPTPPSELIDDIDPIVDRVIMKCLEKDPRQRPASAMAVSAALPGGNPLREILAAGETPSPEVVAAAGEAHGVMRPNLAVALLVTALLCLIGFVYMAPQVFVVQRALDPPPSRNEPPRDRAPSPTVMVYKAQSLLKTLGYTDPPADSAFGYEVNRSYYNYVERNRAVSGRLWRLWRPRLGFVYFWYRQGPDLLIPLRPEGSVVERDPAPLLDGMVQVQLDPLGRLIGLEARPGPSTRTVRVEQDAWSETAPAPPPPSATAPDDPWNIETLPPATRAAASSRPAPRATTRPTDFSPLLEAADVDVAGGRFVPTTPRGTLPVDADERVAWEGYFNERTSVRNELVRVEAAAYRGKPVFFAVIGAWQDAPMSEDRAHVVSAGEQNLLVQTLILWTLLAAAGVLAFKNYRSGRGDRQGATRMALAFFLLGVVSWIFRAHHVPDPVFEFLLFQRGMGSVLYVVSLVWILYLALEPYVRRVWPETVISWSRLLAGKWFDPLVGRDVLAGGAVGVMTTLLAILEYQVPRWVGSGAGIPEPLPSIMSVSQMLTATQNLSGLFDAAIGALYLGLLALLFLVLVRLITRRPLVAGLSFVVLFAIATAHYRQGEPLWSLGVENLLSLSSRAALAVVLLGLLTRHGLVAVIFCLLVRALLMDFPVTWDFASWYAGAALAAIGGVLAVLGLGFYAAMEGRGLFADRQSAEH